jgi:hypothetical protein
MTYDSVSPVQSKASRRTRSPMASGDCRVLARLGKQAGRSYREGGRGGPWGKRGSVYLEQKGETLRSSPGGCQGLAPCLSLPQMQTLAAAKAIGIVVFSWPHYRGSWILKPHREISLGLGPGGPTITVWCWAVLVSIACPLQIRWRIALNGFPFTTDSLN